MRSQGRAWRTTCKIERLGLADHGTQSRIFEGNILEHQIRPVKVEGRARLRASVHPVAIGPLYDAGITLVIASGSCNSDGLPGAKAARIAKQLVVRSGRHVDCHSRSHGKACRNAVERALNGAEIGRATLRTVDGHVAV